MEVAYNMAISDKITSMTNHLTADYDAIESVVGEVTVNKNIENIAPLLDNLWEELPHTTGSGTELTINDTRAGKMKVQPMGNTSQTQKTGKNLLNIQTSSSSQFGITVTKNSDGTLKVNGTATADAAVIFNTTVTLAAGTYTLSGCPSGGSFNTYNLNLDQLSTMRDNGSGVTFTLNSERTSTAYVSVKSGVTMNNVIFKPMIVSGSTSGDFEPYTGKKATPNPDNPEQVHTCSGDNEVVVTGKNIFDLKGWLTANNISYTENSDGSLTFSSTVDLYNNPLVFSDTNISVSLSGVITTGTAANPRLQLLNSSNTIVGEITTSTSKRENISACKIRFNYSTAGSVTLKNIMLNTGATAQPYEPYQSSTYPINLPVENLASLETTGTSIGGVSFTKENVVIKINGTTNSSSNFYFNSFRAKSGTATYWVEVTGYTDKASGNCSIILQQSTDNSTWSLLSDISLKSTATHQASVTLDSSKYYRIRWYTENNTFTNATIKIQLEYGNKKNSFTPYGTTPIGLNKISTYKDSFFKAINGDDTYDNLDSATKETLDYGEWYLKKEILRKDLGELNWLYGEGRFYSNDLRYTINKNQGGSVVPNNILCENYTVITPAVWYAKSTIGISVGGSGYGNDGSILVYNSNYTDTTTFKNAMSGNYVYCTLISPTYTKIEGTLAEQLEDVWRVYSYNGQTNVSQSNNDLPFVLDVTALEG
jgi:hypothetical protein